MGYGNSVVLLQLSRCHTIQLTRACLILLDLVLWDFDAYLGCCRFGLSVPQPTCEYKKLYPQDQVEEPFQTFLLR